MKTRNIFIQISTIYICLNFSFWYCRSSYLHELLNFTCFYKVSEHFIHNFKRIILYLHYFRTFVTTLIVFTMASSSSAEPSPTKKQKFEHIVSSSWSHVDCEPDTKFEKIQHVCTIGGFSKKMEMKPGTNINSADFTIKTDNQSTKWRFLVNPNGDSDASNGQISCNQRCIRSRH